MQMEDLGPGPPSRGEPPTPTGGQTRGLYERYAPSSRGGQIVGHSPTRSSRIRSQGLRLTCYLNGEVSTTRAHIVHLPDECDTLGEVLPKIQSLMHLEKKLLYAAELYLPDGTKIDTFRMLVEAADKDAAIIVACGESFDATTVPYELLEFYLHGGGRKRSSASHYTATTPPSRWRHHRSATTIPPAGSPRRPSLPPSFLLLLILPASF